MKTPHVSLRQSRAVRLVTSLIAGCTAIALVSAAPASSAAADRAEDTGTPVSTASSSWTPVFFDDFNRTELGPDWSPYFGRPSSDPRTWWDPTMVWLSGGALTLAGAPSTGHSNLWRTGGLSNWKSAQTYGKWEIRFRTHASQVLSYHFLLWPKASTWPPEIDITEGYSRPRTSSQAFIHWVDPNGSRKQSSFSTAGDFTQWNTVSVEWTPDSVRFFLNGVQYGIATGDAVPNEPMFLALQTETRLAASLEGQSSQPQYVWVDWVRISKWNPPQT